MQRVVEGKVITLCGWVRITIRELKQSVLGDKGPLPHIQAKGSRRVKTSYPKPIERHPGTHTKCSLREMVSQYYLIQSVHEGL